MRVLLPVHTHGMGRGGQAEAGPASRSCGTAGPASGLGVRNASWGFGLVGHLCDAVLISELVSVHLHECVCVCMTVHTYHTVFPGNMTG